MSDEEKEAIKTVKFCKEIKWYSDAFDNGTELLSEDEKQDIDIVLNLIKNQQKEIEELKEKNQKIESINYRVNKNLLETAEELEELKDIQQQICNEELFTKEYIEENFISKDKIKAEIKELQNMKVDGEVFTTAVNFAIKEMQSLLEKE